ncbi:helix-turn-helix domain-containing protein [Halomonas maura]|uniref:helix-turn-helix domain-containing protein n=1 Tax=Halomonas maura TaxID=117606 RepID=UPI0025B2B066|nr:helix-turn-helix domain-containing protein [Halomonas maura]MDN3555255.1 helix-turn-helix domain-containing protein [Halomonas maura]
MSERRLEAVRLRLDGVTVAETARRTGLSAPTVSAAWKAFREGGWDAVPIRPRGRPAGQAHRLGETQQRLLWQRLTHWPDTDEPGWSSRALAQALTDAETGDASPRAIEHWLVAQDLKPSPMALDDLVRRRTREGRWFRQQVQPALEGQGVVAHWLGGVRVAQPATSSEKDSRRYQLYLHGKRGALYSRCFTAPPRADDYLTLFERLASRGPMALIFHGAYFRASPEVQDWLVDRSDFSLITVPPNITLRAASARG